jgi:phage-related protein (TIGR01555 family)
LSDKKKSRNDSFANAMLGSGIRGRDPLQNTFYKRDRMLTDQELARLYYNALVRKIIDTPAEEAVKNWIKIKGDTEDCLAIQMHDDLNTEEHFANGLRWSRLFGGSAVLMTINDGGTLEDELNEKNIMEIEALRVYDKREVIINEPMLMNDDPYSKNYGLPEWIQICPQSGGMPFYVHRSRVLTFDGDPIPNDERARRSGWGLPTMQGLFDAIAHNDDSYSTGRLLLERMSQAIVMLNGLNEKIETDEGSEVVKQRLDLIDLARSIRNIMALDKEDEFKVFNVPLTNVPEMIDRFGMFVSALANIPYTMLFGRNTSGLNSNDQSQLENFYSFVGRMQKRRLKGNVDRLTKLLMLSRNGLFKGIEPKGWKVELCPLWVPSEKERAETEKLESDAKKAKAETAKTYADINALDGSEVRQMLSVDSEYAEHMDMSLDMSGEVIDDAQAEE